MELYAVEGYVGGGRKRHASAVIETRPETRSVFFGHFRGEGFSPGETAPASRDHRGSGQKRP